MSGRRRANTGASRAATIDGMSGPDAVDLVAAALAQSELAYRRLGPQQLGFAVECGGWPLEVGVRVEGPVLRAQACVCGPGQVNAHELLHDHRKRAFARFTHAECGTVWVEAELPAGAVTADLVDLMLGALLDAAELGRHRAAASGSAP